MTPRGLLLALSLAANVALASLLFARGSKPHPQPVVAKASARDSKSTTPRVHSAGGARGAQQASAPAEGGAADPPGFKWSQLESEDYEQYIAALRAFGVPERTIRDLIIADVSKLYRPKLAALRGTRKTAVTNFWENRNYYGPSFNQTPEQREQSAALRKEETDLVKKLLGEDVYRQMAQDSGMPDWSERMFGAIPDSLREQVQAIQDRLNQTRSEIYAKADNDIDQDTQRDLKALNKKAHDEMAAILTPEQLENYGLRSSEIANQMRWELSSFEPTEKEFRAIFKYKQATEGLQANMPDFGDPAISVSDRKAQQDQRRALDDQLKQDLGDRYKEYQLTEQWEYRNLAESGVPRDTLLQVFDMKQQVQDATSKLRQDKSLTDEERARTLQAIRTETESKLTELVGERRAKAYMRNGGYWVRNIAPKP